MSLKEKVALITGLVGFTIEVLSFVVEAWQGNMTNMIVLRTIGVFGISVWFIWVTYAVVRFTREMERNRSIPIMKCR